MLTNWKKILRIFVLSATLMAAGFSYSSAQGLSGGSDVTFFFRVNKWDIERGYLGNNEAILRLDRIVEEYRTSIDSVTIVAYASPEGRFGSNIELSRNRARSMRAFLEKTYPEVDFKKISYIAGGPDFGGLTGRLLSDPDVPFRDEVLGLVSDWGKDPDATFAKLRQLRGGEPYRYIRYKYLPLLRSATTIVFHVNKTVSDDKSGASSSENALASEDVSEGCCEDISECCCKEISECCRKAISKDCCCERFSSRDADVTEVAGPLDSFRIHFRKRDYSIDSTYMDNAEVLEQIRSFLSENPRLDTVYIRSFASPEGSAALNSLLSDRRAESTLAFIEDHVSDSTVVILESLGEDWERWTEVVENNYFGPDREKALRILRSGADNKTKKAQLKTLSPSNYYLISQELTKTLRASEIRLVPSSEAVPRDTTQMLCPYCTDECCECEEPTELRDTTLVPLDSTLAGGVAAPVEDVVEPLESSSEDESYRLVPLFALTTNLLYETAGTAATLFHTVPLTVGYEIPIGKHWSFFSNYLVTTPWHAWDNNAECAELMHWDLGAKWFPGGGFRDPFTPSEGRRVLEGWYAYLGAGCGYYDFEHGGKGYQGEEILASLGLGYGLSFDSHWSLDFGLGFGPMYTRYRYYEGTYNNEHLMYRYSGNFRYLGLTDARVKLSYLFYAKKKNK